MRQIKTENIKVDTFPTVLIKADTAEMSKEDFLNQLNSFLTEEKNTEESIVQTEEIAEDKENNSESEEELTEFEAIHTHQMINLIQTNYQSFFKTEDNADEINIDVMDHTSLSSDTEVRQSMPADILHDQDGFESSSKIKQEYKSDGLSKLMPEEFNVTFQAAMTNIPEYNSSKVEEAEEPKLTTQAMVSDIITDLSELKSQKVDPGEQVDILPDNPLSEAKNRAVQETLSNFIKLEKSNQTIQVIVNEIITEVPELNSLKPELAEIISEFVDLIEVPEKSAEIQQVTQDELVTQTPDLNEITEPNLMDQGVEKNNAVETETPSLLRNNVKMKTIHGSDDEIPLGKEGEKIKQVSNSINEFDPVNRLMTIHQTSASEKTVFQKDFQTYIETLIIEETESADSQDKISTARIQLSPEHLGKVDLQIEINNKELTAKLIVEQEETKEWIDQQVAQLKEKLLIREINVKDFQVVVNKDNMNDSLMNSEENPFFKQNQKKSQTRKEQLSLKNEENERPVRAEEKSYSTRNGISILV